MTGPPQNMPIKYGNSGGNPLKTNMEIENPLFEV